MADPVWVYPFESAVRSPVLLGGKGLSLARMLALGLPIPPGFTIGTTAWAMQRELGGTIPAELRAEIDAAVSHLEQALDRRLDDPQRPLLVSVRSGAPVSMPGMMDTVLNVGLSEPVVEALARRTNDEFAWGVYARLLSTYADVVRELDDERRERTAADAEATGSARARALAWKAAIAAHGEPFPARARDQLDEAIQAVWRSWDGERARRYRKFRGISEAIGTAVTVQAMVFGNLDQRSGTGVVFSRDPATDARRRTGTSCRRPRVTTSLPGRARRTRSSGPSRTPPRRSPSCARRSRCSRPPIATCATSSSPSRAAACGSSRRGSASAAARPPCSSPPTWSTRD